MPTVCLASLEPRKLKLNLGSPYPKGDAAPLRCRIGDATPRAKERCNSLPEKRSSNSCAFGDAAPTSVPTATNERCNSLP